MGAFVVRLFGTPHEVLQRETNSAEIQSYDGQDVDYRHCNARIRAMRNIMYS